MSGGPASSLRKILIRLPDDSWHGHGSETMWAESLGGDRYRLRNVPFYATGISAEDIVITRDEGGIPVVTGVVLHGGHSTYRIFLSDAVTPDDAAFKKHWVPLERLGCTYEGATQRLFGVDIPPRADIHLAYRLLEEGEAAGVWAFEEGHCGHSV